MATMTMPQAPTPSPVLQANNQAEKTTGLRNMENGKACKPQVEDNKKKGPMQEGQECAKSIMLCQDSSQEISNGPNPKEMEEDEMTSFQSENQEAFRDDSNAWSPLVVRKKKGGRKRREATGF
ncbi:hypothetical protein OIU77_015112 [Salix suchowensis]|uniref:Uncharacterized protein n=1 Tax=Salix suchowensis TaxID=1278906 RepID=A0ABQ8ZSC6_9ROSI|nr:hypothetical protein OIU77_015112 [Salix suchowensis]